MPTALAGCAKQDLTIRIGDMSVKEALLTQQINGQLDIQLNRAYQNYLNTHGSWDCPTIKVVSRFEKISMIRPLVMQKFAPARTVDLLVEASFLKCSLVNTKLNLPMVLVADETYYLNTYERPLSLSIPVGKSKLNRKPFHYITKEMLEGSMIIQKI